MGEFFNEFWDTPEKAKIDPSYYSENFFGNLERKYIFDANFSTE